MQEAIKKQADYLRKGITFTQNQVCYFLVDKDNEIVAKSGYGSSTYRYGESETSACFASIFRSIPKTAVAAYVCHPTEKMAYDPADIKRFVADLCEMGFKCEYLEEWGDKTIFRIDLLDMETKNQFCSTLTLIRTLYEAGSAKVPEHYFRDMDARPAKDKFEALQDAHKHPGSGGYSLGLGHNVTNRENGPNITLEALYDRFKKEKKTPFSEGGTTLNKCWAGEGSRNLMENY